MNTPLDAKHNDKFNPSWGMYSLLFLFSIFDVYIRLNNYTQYSDVVQRGSFNEVLLLILSPVILFTPIFMILVFPIKLERKNFYKFIFIICLINSVCYFLLLINRLIAWNIWNTISTHQGFVFYLLLGSVLYAYLVFRFYSYGKK